MSDITQESARDARIAEAVRASAHAIEWPTLTLVLAVYFGWAAVTYFHAAMPLWLVSLVGAVLITAHSSLQHEMLHGHPTRWRGLNRQLASIPLSLWLPYESYRISHLIHHVDDRLTDPLDDPESYYWSEQGWRSLGPIGRALVWAQSTLAGRMLIGPFWNIGRFLRDEAGKIWAGDRTTRRIWSAHLLHVAPVLAWLVFVADMNLAFYLFAIVYPGTAILLIRSFAEHRAEANVIERTAIVEGSWLLGPLFLFNNLHAAHHALPTKPWYELPAWYRANRERLIAENDGLVYRTYFDVARRYLFTPHDRPSHPFGRAPSRLAAGEGTEPNHAA
ncbi:fatty acid desaturase [Kaistia dalseonensis]|uniref:Fatty acid desaturase n=1 Tax=Kaistia dalseonensis TaxID=410840 RepID=A0ABU0H6G9_9HYPH|nr:fatty acid desaturase [Kaistia dalseonensis]MCX5495040.1 fatty acid desaturase [Kaistia dalseonensis]MDQ0437622.1 fatty acid desaturase [Kaistia dalseonensis]